jgi:hypothetical protein
MAKVEGVFAVQKALQECLKRVDSGQGQKGESVIVGYTANYALFVHENLEANHKAGKQAKFLETPARVMNSSGQLAMIIRRAMKNMRGSGPSLQDALLLAGLAIQRASQQIVPIDTGNLRGSAFTRKE